MPCHALLPACARRFVRSWCAKTEGGESKQNLEARLHVQRQPELERRGMEFLNNSPSGQRVREYAGISESFSHNTRTGQFPGVYHVKPLHLLGASLDTAIYCSGSVIRGRVST